MYDYQEYCKITSFGINLESSLRMYKMYVEGENEIAMYEARKKAVKKEPTTPTPPDPFSLGPITGLQASMVIIDDFPIKQEVENTMTTVTNPERAYLVSRISNVFYTKKRELQKQFKIGEDLGPRTYKELIDWVKHGKYTLNEKITKRIDAYGEEDLKWSCHPLEGFIWTALGNAEELRKKYDDAILAMEFAQQDALDVINTSEAAEGLKAFKKFKDASFA